MIRAFLVDDEDPARDRLKRLLADFPDVVVVGEASDGELALREIPRLAPDLVFLDIQMPGRTGMEVVASLQPPRPRIIFSTAFDHYAIRAFEHHAMDYLLKPLGRERLARALQRVREELGSQQEMRQELASASQTQALLYPAPLASLSGLEVCGFCRPAREVGGDYYDFLPLGEGRIALAVGDVSGKGLFAALLMAGLHGRLQGLARRYGEDVPGLFDELNRAMLAITGSNRYATLFYGVYDEAARRLSYVNAGHPAPLLLRREGPGISSGAEPLTAGGTVVGLLPEAEYPQGAVHLAEGDLLLIFSDGLIETRDPAGAEMGANAIESVARKHAQDGVAEIRDRILEAGDAHRAGGEVEDDVTLVVARAQ